jgi:hypothetical protein
MVDGSPGQMPYGAAGKIMLKIISGNQLLSLVRGVEEVEAAGRGRRTPPQDLVSEVHFGSGRRVGHRMILT